MSNPSPTLVAVLRAYEDLESCPISPDPAPRVELKTSRRLTDTETELAVALYEAGMNVDEVANQFGVHRHTMSTRLKAAGVQLRFAALTRKQISEAIKLYQEGWSLVLVSTSARIHQRSGGPLSKRVYRVGTVMGE